MTYHTKPSGSLQGKTEANERRRIANHTVHGDLAEAARLPAVSVAACAVATHPGFGLLGRNCCRHRLPLLLPLLVSFLLLLLPLLSPLVSAVPLLLLPPLLLLLMPFPSPLTSVLVVLLPPPPLLPSLWLPLLSPLLW